MRVISLFVLLFASIVLLLIHQVMYSNRVHKLNLQISSLLDSQPRTIIKNVDRIKTIYVPSEGKVEIITRDPTKNLEDVVDIKVKRWGLAFRPGLQLGMFPLGIGLDAKVLFINRVGLNGGLIYTSDKTISPTATISYKLDRVPLIQNTELFIGYRPLGTIPLILGIRGNL